MQSKLLKFLREISQIMVISIFLPLKNRISSPNRRLMFPQAGQPYGLKFLVLVEISKRKVFLTLLVLSEILLKHCKHGFQLLTWLMISSTVRI